MPLRAALVVALQISAPVSAQDVHQNADAGKLGSVSFETSCKAEVQPTFAHAMALLHSFEFGPAIAAFTAAGEADPACAIASWGVAVARWGNPFAAAIKPAAQLQQGRAAVERANAIGAKTERERGYVDAAAKLYEHFETVDQRARLIAYRDAMDRLASKFPDDPEASAFYALALAAAADPADKTYGDQLKAGAILERLWKVHPDHPGLAHYIIHSYDVPALAGHAIDAARRYAAIAPAAPHALHMPSHTFTRLGYWQDSIDANIAAATAARKDGAVAEELHAIDYEAYAYLQTGQDAAAQQLVGALPGIAARFNPDAVGSAAPGSAGVFALAAVPARYALERGAWADAAGLEPHPSPYPYADAMTWFARGLGAARSHDLPGARAAVDQLQTLGGRLSQSNEGYWAEQVAIQRLGASAWLAMAEGRTADALATMRAAADREDRTEKNAISPGPLAPARELLGEMLLELKQPRQALAEFEKTLSKEPNRFRAVAGAAGGAGQAGDPAAARRFYGQLLTICSRGDSPGRPELATARRSAK